MSRPDQACTSCLWAKWVYGHSYNGKKGYCLNPLNDQVEEETGVRKADKIYDDEGCDHHEVDTEIGE